MQAQWPTNELILYCDAHLAARLPNCISTGMATIPAADSGSPTITDGSGANHVADAALRNPGNPASSIGKDFLKKGQTVFFFGVGNSQ